MASMVWWISRRTFCCVPGVLDAVSGDENGAVTGGALQELHGLQDFFHNVENKA